MKTYRSYRWIVLFVVWGCGDSEETMWDTTDPEQFCRGAASYQCDVLSECLTEEERMAIGWTTLTACQRDGESVCEDFLVADPTKEYDPDAGAICLSNMANRGCLDVNEPWLDANGCGDDLFSTRFGRFRFSWDPNDSGCGIDPLATVTISIPGQSFTRTAGCPSGTVGETNELPYGTHAYRVTVDYSDGSGGFGSMCEAMLDSELTNVIVTPSNSACDF